MQAPDVLFACIDDWANVAYLFQESMRAVGVDALAVTQKPHGFGYTNQATIMPGAEQQQLADKSKIVVHMHSRVTVKYNTAPAVHHVTFHGGAKYRFAPVQYNEVFNKFVKCTLIQTADLLGLGAKNEVWILPPIDLKAIRPKFGIMEKKIKIAHYPRSSKEKGGPAVNRVMGKIKADKTLAKRLSYTFDSKQVEWERNIERMRACDIYIETLAPLHMKRPHGVWGMTALEAAALGKIVVTNFRGLQRYEREYGPSAIQVADTEEQLEQVIRRLLSLSIDELESLQISTREWAEKHHSFEAVGKKLQKAFDTYCVDAPQAEAKETVNLVDTSAPVPSPAPRKLKSKIPLPIASKPGPNYTQAWWEVYGKKEYVSRNLIAEESAVIQNWLLQNKLLDVPILDVACGTGPIHNALMRRSVVMSRFSCCDCTNALRFRFREITGQLPDYWDGGALPYGDGSFELVMLFDTLQYLPIDSAVSLVSEIARVTNRLIMISAFTGSRHGAVNNRYHVHDYASLWGNAELTVIAQVSSDNGNRTLWFLRK